MSIVLVQPRAAGVALAVDVIVDGWCGHVPIPANVTPATRFDSFLIDGQGWTVRVEPGQGFISDEHIEPWNG